MAMHLDPWHILTVYFTYTFELEISRAVANLAPGSRIPQPTLHFTLPYQGEGPIHSRLPPTFSIQYDKCSFYFIFFLTALSVDF